MQEIQKYCFSNGKLIVKQAIRHLAFILSLLHWYALIVKQVIRHLVFILSLLHWYAIELIL